MKFKIEHIALPVIAIFLLCACKKNKESSVPVIKFVGVNSTDILQFKDSLVITFEYTDGDGDLGEIDPDKNSLQIKDRRLAEADYYFVKPLAPPGSKIHINGTIAIKVKNTFLLGTGNSEVTNFDLKLRDRAGNWSNGISTPEITIKKE